MSFRFQIFQWGVPYCGHLLKNLFSIKLISRFRKKKVSTEFGFLVKIEMMLITVRRASVVGRSAKYSTGHLGKVSAKDRRRSRSVSRESEEFLTRKIAKVLKPMTDIFEQSQMMMVLYLKQLLQS